MLWKCKSCEALKMNIKYQQEIIGSLMKRIGADVPGHKPEPEEPEYSAEDLRKIEDGDMFTYGGDK